MLILSSSLILSGCYSNTGKYLIKSVTSNDSVLDNLFQNKKDRFYSSDYIRRVVNDRIYYYACHGYPFAQAAIRIKSKERVANIHIIVDKGNYVIVNGIESGLSLAQDYLRIWGKSLMGKSYDEGKVLRLKRKILSLSFVKMGGDFEIVRRKGGYILVFPLDNGEQSRLSGNLSFNNKTFTGMISFSSNTFLRRSGYINVIYRSFGKVRGFNVTSDFKNVGYSDFDVISRLSYFTRDNNDYLVNGEAAMAYRSYNPNYFTIGIGGYGGLLSGKIMYVFIRNRAETKNVSLTWGLKGNQADALYFSSMSADVKFNSQYGKISVLSQIKGQYVYPVDTLSYLMHTDLCGYNGVRGYKAMMYLSDKFVMIRNDAMYHFNNIFAAGVNADGAYFGEFIYSAGVAVSISSKNERIKINIAAPGWNRLYASVISGELSYVF